MNESYPLAGAPAEEDPFGPGSDLVLSLFSAMLLMVALGAGLYLLVQVAAPKSASPSVKELNRQLLFERERADAAEKDRPRLLKELEKTRLNIKKPTNPPATIQDQQRRVGPERQVIEELCQKLNGLGTFQVSCAEEEIEQGLIAFALDEFGFDPGQAAIPEDRKPNVIALGRHIFQVVQPERQRIRNVLLSAHADCEEDGAHNMKLSLERAWAIYEIWYQDPTLRVFMDPERAPQDARETGARLVVGGSGEMRPKGLLAPLTRCRKRSKDLRALDRRIEIEITPAKETQRKVEHDDSPKRSRHRHRRSSYK